MRRRTSTIIGIVCSTVLTIGGIILAVYEQYLWALPVLLLGQLIWLWPCKRPALPDRPLTESERQQVIPYRKAHPEMSLTEVINHIHDQTDSKNI